MKTIWKQAIQPNSKRDEPFPITFTAPAGSRPLSVGLQNGVVHVWFECNPQRPTAQIGIFCVGTGFGAVPDNCRFIGTVVDNPYVWHFYAIS